MCKEIKNTTLFNNFLKNLDVLCLVCKQLLQAHYCERTLTETILTMSLLPFWALNVEVVLLSMEGSESSQISSKYLNLCNVDEQRFYGFGTTWGWVINDRIDIFEWTIPLRKRQAKLVFCCYRLHRNILG